MEPIRGQGVAIDCVPSVSQRAAKGGGDTVQMRRRLGQNPLIEAKFAAFAPLVDPIVDSTRWLKMAS